MTRNVSDALNFLYQADLQWLNQAINESINGGPLGTRTYDLVVIPLNLEIGIAGSGICIPLADLLAVQSGLHPDIVKLMMDPTLVRPVLFYGDFDLTTAIPAGLVDSCQLYLKDLLVRNISVVTTSNQQFVRSRTAGPVLADSLCITATGAMTALAFNGIMIALLPLV